MSCLVNNLNPQHKLSDAASMKNVRKQNIIESYPYKKDRDEDQKYQNIKVEKVIRKKF